MIQVTRLLLGVLALSRPAMADTLDFEPPVYRSGKPLQGQDGWRFNPSDTRGKAGDFRVHKMQGNQFIQANAHGLTEYSRRIREAGSGELTWRWRAPNAKPRLCFGPADSLIPGQKNWDKFRVKVCTDSINVNTQGRACKGSPDWIYMRMRLDFAQGRYSLFRDTSAYRAGEDTLVVDGAMDGAGPAGWLFLKAGGQAPFVDVDDIAWRPEDAPPPLTLAITSPAQDTLVNRSPITVAYEVNGAPFSRSVALVEGENVVVIDTMDAFGQRAADTVRVVLDTQPPAVEIVSPEDGALLRSTPVQVVWTVDGVEQTANTWEQLAEGANTIRRMAADAAGNTGQDSVAVTYVPITCFRTGSQTLQYSAPQAFECLVVENGGTVVAEGKITAGSVRIESGGRLFTDDALQAKLVKIDSGGLISHTALSLENEGKRVLIQADTVILENGASIDASGKGYGTGIGSDGKRSFQFFVGGSHGGLGASAQIPVYGNRTNPVTPGSGGGYFPLPGFGGAGGGVVRIQAGFLSLDGSILADGMESVYGSGAGGSIWVSAGAIQGTGSIAANGGGGDTRGGGGRIAVYGCEIPPEIRNSLAVGGHSMGTLFLDCFDDPIVKILSPTEGEILYMSPVPVAWEVNGMRMSSDTVAFLPEGTGDIIRCFTNPHGNTGCDTVTVRVDLHPPVVEILSPQHGTYTNQTPIPVTWAVDGVVQATGNTQALVEGENWIVRSFTDLEGSRGADSVRVILDRIPPVVQLISPSQSAAVLTPSVDIRWSLDGEEQPSLNHAMDTSQANVITLRAADSAGNSDSLLVFLYAGRLVPDLTGRSQREADSLLSESGLESDSAWADNDSVPTGQVFAQSPAPGDTVLPRFPIRYQLSRGPDAVDLLPQSVNADSVTVDPLTLAVGGKVRIGIGNRGRAPVEDSFQVLVFEDRNLDGAYSPSEDMFLGQAANLNPIPPGDSTGISIPLSGAMTFNGNRIGVLVDFQNQIRETNEGNNATHSMAQCRKPPLAVDFSPQVLWEWRDSTRQDPKSVYSLPLVANLNDDNGDGRIDADDMPDVIAATSLFGHDAMIALEGRGGSVLWSFGLAGKHIYPLVDPAVGDLDGDGSPEVVFIQSDPFWANRQLVILDHAGNIKALGKPNQPLNGNLILADLDGDGKSEILSGSLVHNHRAEAIFSAQILGLEASQRMLPVDLDADGFQELFGVVSGRANLNQRFPLFSFKDKKAIQRNAGSLALTGFYPPNHLPAGLGPHRVPGIISAHTTWERIGLAETFDLHLNPQAQYPGVAISDPDFPETVPFANYFAFFGKDSSRNYYNIGWTGLCCIPGSNTRSPVPYFSRTNLVDSSVAYSIKRNPGPFEINGTVFDLNGDGSPEIIVADSDTLHIFDSGGSVLANQVIPKHINGNRVTVADINRDGHADLVVGLGNPDPGNPALIVYTNPTWVGARSIYNQEYYTVTNVNDDGSIPRFPTPHWQADNTVNIQCAAGFYACLDLSASFPQITLNDSGRTEITARIGNGGALELPDGIPVSVYAEHLGAETLLATMPSPRRLKPGEFYTLRLPLAAEMKGRFIFRIVADDSGNGQGGLDESSETNNAVALNFLVNNRAPTLTAPANQYAVPGQPFALTLQATDPDGDTLTYSLAKFPAGMTIQAQTGLLQWTPPLNPPRETVTVAVADPYQGMDSATFILYVDDGSNQPPQITSIPGTTAGLNTITSPTLEVYRYDIVATDPEGEFLEYALTCLNCADFPGGAVPNLDSTRITWIPFQPHWRSGDSARLELKATDARGGIAVQTWSVGLVRTENSAPVFASTPVTAATEDLPWTSPVTVFDLDDDPVTLFFDTIPPGLTFSQDSLRWTPPLPGTFAVRIGATDGIDTVFQRFDLNVAPRNDAPRIVSLPPLAGIAGALYRYTPVTADEEGDALTYSLPVAPAGMTVTAGLIEWPAPATPGATANVRLRVQDPHGGQDEQEWQILLVPDTIPPTVALGFSRNPVRPGEEVTVTVEASDNVGVSAVELLRDGSPVPLLDNAYTFTPTETGSIVFSARAEDALGNADMALAALRVSHGAHNTPPQVALTHAPQNPQAGETVTFTFTASDSDGIDAERLWVLVDGRQLQVAGGQAEFTALRPGEFTARAIAYDSLGGSAEALDPLSVSPIPGDNTPPSAQILSPEEDFTVLSRSEVIGTATDENLAYYTLSHRDLSGGAWVEFHRGETAVEGGVLGLVDATTLVNGDYEIRLDVYDRAGNSASAATQVHVSGEKKVGIFTLTFEDLSIPMAGLNLSVLRSYDSRIKTRGDFGIGWEMGMRSIKLHENRNQGEAWNIQRTPGLIPQYFFTEEKAHTVSVTLPGGRKQEFVPTPEFFSPFDPSQGRMTYRAKPGTYSKLEALDAGDFLVMGGELFDVNGDFQEPYNPQRYRLTLLDDSYFIVDQNLGGVVESGDANGNVTTWRGDGYEHNAGGSIDFSRDAAGRITGITDAAGRSVLYAYDVMGNLAQVMDAEGNVTAFKYGPNHYLNEIIDARGVRAERTEYDEEGRVVRRINAHGDTLRMTHDLDNSTEVIEDFNGNTTVYTYDLRGNVLSKTDDAGNSWAYAYDSVDNLIATTLPGGPTTGSTYDDKGNELTSTDELGNTTTRTYNVLGKVLTSEDPLGRVTRFEYDDAGNLLKETGPDNVVQLERAYDFQGNVLTEKDALGNLTTHTYDSRGGLRTTTDALGRVTEIFYDAVGNVAREVSAMGDTTRYGYDGNGNRILTVNALGDTLRMEYNSIGKVVREVDARGNATRYGYNNLGDKVADSAADGSVVSRTYDAQGNVASITDQVGRVTRMEYDHENRLTRTIFNDGSFISNVYDARGRRIRSVDANGNATEHEYDDAGRNTLVRDALGNETRYEYDDASRKTAMVDALSQRTEYEYDDYDRLVLTRFDDGTTKTMGYDLAGRKISETDQAGKTTGFEYDSVGNLRAVVDALGNRTEYTYDENNNRLTQKNANNHTTSMAYDALNRMVSRTYPNGDQERWEYDANGNAVSYVNGGDSTAYEFDAMNRESLRRYFPSGHEVRTTYTADGNRDSVIDHRGATLFAYDNRGRLALETMANGDFIESQYDAQGNRLLLGTPFDSTRYTYDALNRMDSVVTAEGVTVYRYNPVGNRDSIQNPNGTAVGYSYDNLNRLIEVRNWSGTSQFSRFSYTLNDAGIRMAVDELDGGRLEYGYDGLYRLTSEVRTGGNAYSSTFTYDDVGNRLTQVKDGVTTTYSYNTRDQLTEESSSAGTITYTYDPAGRQTSKTGSAGTTVYTWIDGDRLDSLSGSGVNVKYTYDSEGRRVKEITGGQTKQYLIDRLLPYGQVVLETDGAGNLNSTYTYGLERISQERAGVTHFYLADGQGSIRQLADSAGTVTDTWTYTAFGEQLARTGSTENDFQFVGEQFDGNSGYYYLRQRWMNPVMGRMLSVDPFEGDPQTPVSLHRYLYANASPANFLDPTGELSSRLSLALDAMKRLTGGITERLFGSMAHSAIVKHIAQSNPSWIVQGPFVSIPNPVPPLYVFADLVINRKWLYEIKPYGDEALASSEAWDYISLPVSQSRGYELGMQTFKGTVIDIFPGVNIDYSATAFSGAVTYFPYPNEKAAALGMATVAAYAASPEAQGAALRIGAKVANLSTRYVISGLAIARGSTIFTFRFGF